MMNNDHPLPFIPQSTTFQHGQCFSYALPQGWRVIEEGQFAVVLCAPDNTALTIMAGNSGLPVFYNPGQFVYEKLMATQPIHLWMSQPRPAQPIFDWAIAYEFDYTYTHSGIPCRGIAKCSIAPSYGMCTMAVTCAASHASCWASYAEWLPGVASHVAVRHGSAFGAQGIMAQNLDISRMEGQQAREHREWSQRTWEDVRRQRDVSVAAQNHHLRENLGSVGTWTNPYGYPVMELPQTHHYFWINRQGQVYGTDSPSDNPNMGSTNDWARMNRYQP